MRITKLDPYNVEEPKLKHRASSGSQQKALSSYAKKKLQMGMTNQQPQLAQLCTGFNQQQPLNHDNENYDNVNANSHPLTHSKKTIVGELLFKEPKQTFMDFLQTQMKNQAKQPLQNGKNKIKLPLITSTKQALYSNDMVQDQQSHPDSQKFSNTKNTVLISQKDASKGSTKQNPIFINIKAVIPIQKSTVSKKKDYSLRDLRILRKERENNANINQNDDYVVENGREENSDNSRSKVNTVMTKKTYAKVYDRESSAHNNHTTADKKRAQRSSLDKISSALNTRDKRAFSINQSKKKYATNYQDFCLFISSLNKIRSIQTPIVLYKAFVGKGNNSILVKNAIKNRFWWNIVAEKVNNQEVNFVWSQQRDNDFINDMDCTDLNVKNLANQKNYSQAAKRQKYHLQSRPQEKEVVTREFIRYGFSKLLSEKQSKENNLTPLYAETLTLESLPQPMDPQKTRIHNHLQFNWNLTNKKALFYNLKTYYELIKDDPFKYIPLTFHVKEVGDQSWEEFKRVYEEKIREREGSAMANTGAKDQQAKKKKKEKKDKGTLPLWIIKPGENSNQGCGIQVSDSLEEIVEIVKQKTDNGKNRSSIIQRYLMPFLYNKRKFDIRCYMLATSIKGQIRGYWYEQGYIRTSSKQFTTKNLKNRMIHLTNDAVQKKSEDYGKYENGNKISFGDFQKYLDNNYQDKKLNFYKTVYPKMMRLARDALTATNHVLDAKHREFTFEVFGLDFMIDEEFETWLIEVNNNPCLELSSPLLARIIPNMIENAFKIAIDPVFPPPLNIPKSKSLPTQLFESNKFTLIFTSSDMEEGFQHSISENKVNLDKIIEGEEEDDEVMDDEEEGENFSMKESSGETATENNQKKKEEKKEKIKRLEDDEGGKEMAESQL